MRPALLFLTLTLGTLLPLGGCKGGINGHARKSKSKENTADYASQVQQVVGSPRLEILRWPDFADDQAAVQSFYEDRDQELAWTRDLKPTKATMALLQMFAEAAKKGLNPEDYDAGRWDGRLRRLEAIRASKDGSDAAQKDVAQFDVAVTVAAIRYVSDLHVGRVNPEALNFDIDVPGKRAAFDVATFVGDKLVDADDVAPVVASVEPANPMYRATEDALPHYLELAALESATPPAVLPPLPEGVKPVTAGGTYAALGALLQRLQLEGDAEAGMAVPQSYDAGLAAAVKRYQVRHGLLDDGKLGQATIDSLNVPMSVRVQQFDDSLERWRWLPDNYVQPRVLVNLPEFMLRAYEADHSQAFKMRVVDGEAHGNHDTPMFVRQMRYVVFRPYWNLPPSIVKKEIVPHIQRSGLEYLEAHDYEATKSDGTVVTEFTAGDIARGRYMVRQRPGPKNSLGLVKFLFPNEYDVYMHSTPELPLFGLARRDKSHGCVRLQHADQMALWVLQGDQTVSEASAAKAWDADRVGEAMNGDANNKTYNLKTPLPVVITYLTANADEDGTVHFFGDIYGYDKELEAALAKGRPYPRGVMKINPKLTAGETE